MSLVCRLVSCGSTLVSSIARTLVVPTALVPAIVAGPSLVAVVAVGSVACSSSATESSGSESPEGASNVSSLDRERCKAGCDRMKFFECSDADEHASCYADCNAAAKDQIEVFIGCAEASACDPKCRGAVAKPAAKAPGADPGLCGEACAKAASCGFIPQAGTAECTKLCTDEGYGYQVACIVKAPCSKVREQCGIGSEDEDVTTSTDGGGRGTDVEARAEIFECENACDRVHQEGCIDAGALASCRAKCKTATETRASFAACTRGARACDRLADCLSAF